MHMLDNGTLHASWKYFGSPDQADGLFLVAHPSVDRTTLDGLMDANGPLLPAGSAWLPMDIADVREFTTTDADEIDSTATRAEEHTSELQSLMRNSYAVLTSTKKTNTR